jgi:hypothetical protein
LSTTAAERPMNWIAHQRRWSRGEKRVLLVLLSGARILSPYQIELVAHVRSSTVTIVLDLLAAHDLAGQTGLGHYYLTVQGRAFALQKVGLA